MQMSYRITAVLAILFLVVGISHAQQQRNFQKIQSVGSVDFGTTTAISVGLVPQILISTNVGNAGFNGEPGYSIYPTSGTAGTGVPGGDYVNGRMFLEIYNDTTNQIYIGYNASVSSQPGVNYGRNIPPGTAWSHDCSVKDHYIVADTPTLKKVVVTQEK